MSGNPQVRICAGGAWRQASLPRLRDDYDVVVFFNWHLDTPPAIEKGWWQQGTTEVLKQLGNQEQGIVVLHHAITAFPQWEFWSQLMGNRHEERSWHFENLGDLVKELSFDETLHIEIADSDDPITAGLVPWDIRGETWGPTIGGFPGPDCHVLLTTNHPKMRMKAIAWKLQFRRSRVFCFQPGHDNYSWADKNFRKVLLRGIQWAACRQ